MKQQRVAFYTAMTRLSYLSKSDFKTARECPTKLYYRKKGYPSLKQQDEFMELLAEGGFMVGKLAQLLYPEGVEVVEGDLQSAISQTQHYLSQENVVLFEPAIFVNGMLARIDVLIKRGSCFELIEAKAKSIDGRACASKEGSRTTLFWKKRDPGLDRIWKPYLEDVAFQTYVLQQAFPGFKIHPYLLLCDKSRCTKIDNLLQQFVIYMEDRADWRKNYRVDFTGDETALRHDKLLIKVPVDAEVRHLLPEVEIAANDLAESVVGDLRRLPAPLTTNCKKCEYRVSVEEGVQSGFVECWGALAHVSPHLLELRDLGCVKRNKEQVANDLFSQGCASLFDLPVEWLGDGAQGTRQKLQIEYTRKNQEWIDQMLANVLKGHRYPLHFIDFETSRMALPYHVGMPPYGQIAFQWSCHTIRRMGEPPEHQEWINTKDSYPNLEFAESLMNCLGDDGTVFMWSHHERSVMNDICKQMTMHRIDKPDLVAWIDCLSERLVDLCKLAKRHYFHPAMGGSVSIKYVLPAVWNNNPYLHEIPYFKPYFQQGPEGKVVSPYDTLQSIDIVERAEVIKEGTGAMRAYQEMMYGLYRGDVDTHAKWTELLRQYCVLDTMAMIIVYRHWCTLLNVNL